MSPRIILTSHAISRYRERVKPHLDPDAAETELRRLVELAGEPTTQPPAWITSERERSYLVLCDGIALALSPGRRGRLIAHTCLTRAGMGEQARERRNRNAQGRRARRQSRRRPRADDKAAKLRAADELDDD